MTAPHRIVLYDDHEQSGDLGGGQYARLDLYQRLDRNCFEPIVLCSQEGQITAEARARGLKVCVRPINPNFDWFSRYELLSSPSKMVRLLTRTMTAGRKLANVARQLDADLLHPNENLSRLVTVFSRPFHSIPCVMHVDNEWDSGWTDFLMRHLFVASFDRLIAVSEPVAELASKVWWSADSKIDMVHTGVASKPFEKADPKAFRRELGVEPETVVLTTIGRLVPFKGQHRVIRALSPLVGSSHPGFALVVVGDGPQRRELETVASDVGMSQYTTFTGYRNDIPNILAGTDLLVHASRSESLGLVLIEALMAGCDVVATHSRGANAVLAGGIYGQIVPSGELDELTEVLAGKLREVGSPTVSLPVSKKRNKQYAQNKFGLDACVRQTESVLAQVCK